MEVSFDTVIRSFGNNAGIEIPPEALTELAAGKRPKLLVQVGDYRYSTTVGSMNGMSLLSLSKAHRDESGLQAGQQVHVVLQVDTAPTQIDVPQELAAALKDAGLTDAFDTLAPSRRKEYARQISDAKTDATRDRRLAKVLAELG